jgi:hypothetical protein
MTNAAVHVVIKPSGNSPRTSALGRTMSSVGSVRLYSAGTTLAAITVS